MSLTAFLALRIPSMLAEMRAYIFPGSVAPYRWPTLPAHALPDPLTLPALDGWPVVD